MTPRVKRMIDAYRQEMSSHSPEFSILDSLWESATNRELSEYIDFFDDENKRNKNESKQGG